MCMNFFVTRRVMCIPGPTIESSASAPLGLLADATLVHLSLGIATGAEAVEVTLS